MNEVFTVGTRMIRTSAVGWMISCFHVKKGQPMFQTYEEDSPEYRQIVETNPLIAKHIKESEEKLDNSMFKGMHIFKLFKYGGYVGPECKKEIIYVRKALIATYSNRNKVKAYNSIYRKIMTDCNISCFEHIANT